MTHTPVATHVQKLVRPVEAEPLKSKVKFKIHLCAISFAGMVYVMLFHYHVANELLLSFGPLIPNILQEIVDMLKRL